MPEGMIVDCGGKYDQFVAGAKVGAFIGEKTDFMAGNTNSLTGGLSTNVLLGVNLVLKAALCFSLLAVGEKEFGTKNFKIIVREDNVSAIRNDLNAICKLIIGEDSKVAAQTKIVNGKFDVTAANGTQTAANQTVSVLSLLNTVAKCTEAIATKSETCLDTILTATNQTTQVVSSSTQAASSSSTTGNKIELATMFTIV
jgi:hypothetical protein